MKSKVDLATLDQVRRLIATRADEVGVTWQDLSLRIGRNASYIHEFIRRSRLPGLPEEVRGKVAQILGIDPERLRGPAPPPFFAPAPGPSPPLGAAAGPAAAAADLIPVYRDDGPLADGGAIDRIPRPSVLPAEAHGYGIWLSRDSGRLRAGDLLICDPRRPARPGDLVVVESGQRVVALGELRAIEADAWRIDSGGGHVVDATTSDARLAKVVATQHA